MTKYCNKITFYAVQLINFHTLILKDLEYKITKPVCKDNLISIVNLLVQVEPLER